MKHASVYERARSPYFYVSYYCVKKMKRVHEATPWRVGDPSSRKLALRFAAAKSQEADAFRGVRKTEVWSVWVEKHLENTFRKQPRTLDRYKEAWDWVRVYLDEKQVYVPAAVTYMLCQDYVDWRLAKTERRCGRPVSRNTAIFEIKVFGGLMNEAVRRGFRIDNPCQKLGLKRDPAKEKQEMTDAEIATIRAELATLEGTLPLPDRWMTISFEIGIHQGCRLAETAMAMTAVSLEANTLRFIGKGRNGVPKIFTTALHPGLRPLMQDLVKAGAGTTCRHPKMPSLQWFRFLNRIGMGHLCFHCTRVTVITRLARAGVPMPQAMRFVGHSSEQVHAIYQKLKCDDLSACTDALASVTATGIDATPQSRDGA